MNSFWLWVALIFAMFWQCAVIWFVFCAPFVMLWRVHPSKCSVLCILRDALCEKCLRSLGGFWDELGPNEACARGVSEKTSPPFLAHGLSKVFDRSLYGASGGMCLKVFRKTSPPSYHISPEVREVMSFWAMHAGVLFWRKNVSPLPCVSSSRMILSMIVSPLDEDLSVLYKKNVSPFCFMLTVCFGKQVIATQSDMR